MLLSRAGSDRWDLRGTWEKWKECREKKCFGYENNNFSLEIWNFIRL
jgi:hypothetical protein